MSGEPETIIEPSSDAWWGARFIRGDGQLSAFSFSSDADVSPPSVMDGLAAAVLPTALRSGGRLRVEGPMTRRSLRNLIEMGEAWVSWKPDVYRPLEIIPVEVVDPLPRKNGSVAAAWSGSLRSSHTLVRHRYGLIKSGCEIDGAVRVWGLHPDEINTDSASALQKANDVFQQMGIRLHVVTVSMDDRTIIDPFWGTQSWIAGALHAMSAEYRMGFIARPWLWKSQLKYPRPEPTVPDLWSGELLDVRIDGGAALCPQMAEDVSAYPELFRLISNCTKNPRHRAPCGRCKGCRVLSLSQAARGLPTTTKPPGLCGIATFPMHDPICRCEVESILSGSPKWQDTRRKYIHGRVALNHKCMLLRNTLRWIGSATRVSPIFPR